MNELVKETVFLIAEQVEKQIPGSLENKYYKKMCYSDQNTILDSDIDVLRKTIAFEVAFIHIICFILSQKTPQIEYFDLLKKLDKDEMYSWYIIRNIEIETRLKQIELSFLDIYNLINKHDTFINKDIKKKLGQFYTPVGIARKMVLEIKSELKRLSKDELLVDPACGTGVFLVEIIKAMSEFMSTQRLCEFVQNNIYGYDVNPFSVIATKLNIINILFDIINQKKEYDVFERMDFELKNVKWKNTIVENEDNVFSVIIGNPPYFKLNSVSVEKIGGYGDIVYGQPNIYSLFVYWGLKYLKDGGTMNFIVPQSIRSGLYFKNIRREIAKYRIISILHIDSRQNIFDRAEQAVLIICLKKKPIRNTKTKVQFIDGEQNVFIDFSVDRKKIMLGAENNYMFVISKHSEIYDVYEKIYSNSFTLSNNNVLLKFSNGLFVWNQHKDLLVDSDENGIPVIYGGCVQPVEFEFKKSWSNKERKAYAKLTADSESFKLFGKRLLVQRTTNFEKDIRIKACLISEDFLKENDNYFLENHINFLVSKSNKEELVPENDMFFYLGLLNSKLLNFIFSSKSGNTQVSANELNLLPFPQNMKKEISLFVSRHLVDLSLYQNELDLLVCKAYGLSIQEANIIMNI